MQVPEVKHRFVLVLGTIGVEKLLTAPPFAAKYKVGIMLDNIPVPLCSSIILPAVAPLDIITSVMYVVTVVPVLKILSVAAAV